MDYLLKVNKPTACLRVFAIVLLALFCLPSAFANHGGDVLIITSSSSSYQATVAAILARELKTSHVHSKIIHQDKLAMNGDKEVALYVGIGRSATQTINAFNNDTPVLRLVSSTNDETSHTSLQASLYMDQPPCRNFALIRAINPDWKNVAVLASEQSLDNVAALTRCAIRYNLNLNIYPIIDTGDLMVSLGNAAEINDVLLATPDAGIYNRQSIKSILLTTYRQRKPVIGFSENFVDAGAVAAVYTPAQSVAERAADIIARFFLNQRRFSEFSYYPSDFSVVTNRQVSRALDLEMDDTDTIIDRMHTLESLR